MLSDSSPHHFKFQTLLHRSSYEGDYSCCFFSVLPSIVKDVKADFFLAAYEYVPDSEIASVTVSTSEKGPSVPETGPSGSEEDVIDASLKVLVFAGSFVF